MNKLGRLKVEDDSFKVNIALERLKQGINDLQDHVIKVDSDNKIEYVINKVCDHAGGRLIIKGGEAICPMHNWKLNLESLEYNNSHVCKKTIEYFTEYRIQNTEYRIQNTEYRIQNRKVKYHFTVRRSLCQILFH